MNITEKKVSELKEAEYNPRHIDEAKLELLKKSITEDIEFLSVRPLIVNMYKGRENVVIGGNMRLRAAKELKLEEVPVIVVKVPLAKEKVWNLKDNNGYGYWDNEMLHSMVEEMSHEDIDLTLTGFSDEEIKGILEVSDPTAAAGNPNWEDEWKDMPEFIQGDSTAFRSLIVHFEKKEDVEKFVKLINQNVTENVKYIWFPEKKKEQVIKRYTADES